MMEKLSVHDHSRSVSEKLVGQVANLVVEIEMLASHFRNLTVTLSARDIASARSRATYFTLLTKETSCLYPVSAFDNVCFKTDRSWSAM